MKTDADLISEKLLILIEEKNLTINRLATLAGLKQSTLNSIFTGASKRPTITTVRKLCQALEISVHEFFDFPPYNEVEK
ncbi:helix-turn-helix transcriptional regulator [Listeria seeligeri]|uniref:Helix-turn-helix transcriptional regulator n=1 Tax=Listeria immobilis TaxID=2713502 RepID=A0ABR6SUS3_9LIST|nr:MULTISPECIES: helix-turn-helix transcriptional regulator [Listeria]EAD3699777.1 XRE family transcriptional regulator [Listeria monocytogenes]EEO3297207.1 helix-turn-helix transcriptional regulator [Listeria monocytogenes]EEO6789710.1 helix-turn-helix transcriptional regulator [Listeria monocytogenes]EEO9414333.1 helix-turn-helix transcriptional regulator [Listeria monocytogenes]EGP8643742.1 helix-turn-helix transcriptional regulator [Listeria monocytogenes]